MQQHVIYINNLYSPKQTVANNVKKRRNETKKNYIHYRKLDHTWTMSKFWEEVNYDLEKLTEF